MAISSEKTFRIVLSDGEADNVIADTYAYRVERFGGVYDLAIVEFFLHGEFVAVYYVDNLAGFAVEEE
mgnify:CR=1 FL=1